MSFRPFGDKYSFDKTVLTEDFPDYLLEPVTEWAYDIMYNSTLINTFNGLDSTRYVDSAFRQDLQLRLREAYSEDWSNFISQMTSTSDRLCNFLAYLLQNYSNARWAARLEAVLRLGSSAYTVAKVRKDAEEYISAGVYDLAWYVPSAVRQEAEAALLENEILLAAWNDCYRLKPSYSSCVSSCNDFLEGYLRDKYWPQEKRTLSIYSSIKKLEANPDLLRFRGDSFLKDKTRLIALLEGISKIRGQHKSGAGRSPTKSEAEYVLHTTIYVWNLLNGA
jgi:hypothetical protein